MERVLEDGEELKWRNVSVQLHIMNSATVMLVLHEKYVVVQTTIRIKAFLERNRTWILYFPCVDPVERSANYPDALR